MSKATVYLDESVHKAVRIKAAETRLGKLARKVHITIFGFAAVTIFVFIILIQHFFNLPQSHREVLIVNASLDADFYFDGSYDLIKGNNRLIISIRSGTVDYIIFAPSESRDYPRYVGGTVRENQAVGHVFLSANTDPIEVTHSRKAYEFTLNGVKEAPLNLKMSPFDVSKFIQLLGVELTLEKLIEIKDEI